MKEVATAAPRRWSSGILKAAGVRVRYENEGALPRGRPQILVANHQSWFDVFALAGTLPVDYRFVGKKELTKIPLFGPAWQVAGHYAIDRSDRQAAIASLNAVGHSMREKGHSIVLFPEGTRSPDGTLAPFKKGAFVMAINAEVPVVPIAITGSRAVMPKGKWSVRPGEIVVRIGEPIPTVGIDVDDRDQLTREAWRRVAALKGESVAENGRAVVDTDGGGATDGTHAPAARAL